MADIEIEKEDELLFKAMLMAHKKNITLNQLIEQILREYLAKFYNKISVTEMENGLIFDRIFDNVIENNVKYTIYEDETYTKPLAVLVKYEGGYYEA